MSIGEPRLADSRRVAVARERRRLLYGEWTNDALRRIKARLGAIRRDAVGMPDLSANPFRSVCHQVAVTYDREPRISHPDDDAERTLARALEERLRSSLWSSKMQRVQRDCVGIREHLVRWDVTARGRLVIRPVFADRVDLTADAEEPDRPAHVREARVRHVRGRDQWAYDEIDARDGSYRVLDGSGADITVEALGAAASGEAYPYTYADGTPFLPHVLYHATPTAELWDPNELRELYEATLESCVLWSFWSHCVRDASWPQRYLVELEPLGATTEGTGASSRAAVTTDPSSVLQLRRSSTDPGGTPSPPGQWTAGSNPKELAEALLAYEGRLAAYVGVTEPEFIRTSGDPRSGYALAISRDGKRAAARKFEPQFRAGDEESLAKAAALLNRHRETGGEGLPDGFPELPETGWRVRYLGLPLTPDEQDARRREVLELLEAGMISRARAYARIHEMDDDEAAAELAELDAAAGTTTTTTAGAAGGGTDGSG